VIGNMSTYAKSRMPEKTYDQIVNTFNDLIMQIETLTNPRFLAESESKYHIKAVVNQVFDSIAKDDVQGLQAVL
jgi:hypothetical protein